ncbi:hypothetical protein CF319_g6136 [Tilletia indica]|nr:hypothetical protein CF319_g6136 [Tilletia indica]
MSAYGAKQSPARRVSALLGAARCRDHSNALMPQLDDCLRYYSLAIAQRTTPATMPFQGIPQEIVNSILGHVMGEPTVSTSTPNCATTSVNPDDGNDAVQALKSARSLSDVSRSFCTAVGYQLTRHFCAFDPPTEVTVRGVLGRWMPRSDARHRDVLRYWQYHCGAAWPTTPDLRVQALMFDKIRADQVQTITVDTRVPDMAMSTNPYHWSMWNFPSWIASSMLLSRISKPFTVLTHLHLRITAQSDIMRIVENILLVNPQLVDVVIEADAPLEMDFYTLPVLELDRTTTSHHTYPAMQRFILRAPAVRVTAKDSSAFFRRISQCKTVCFAVNSIHGDNNCPSWQWSQQLFGSLPELERGEISIVDTYQSPLPDVPALELSPFNSDDEDSAALDLFGEAEISTTPISGALPTSTAEGLADPTPSQGNTGNTASLGTASERVSMISSPSRRSSRQRSSAAKTVPRPRATSGASTKVHRTQDRDSSATATSTPHTVPQPIHVQGPSSSSSIALYGANRTSHVIMRAPRVPHDETMIPPGPRGTSPRSATPVQPGIHVYIELALRKYRGFPVHISRLCRILEQWGKTDRHPDDVEFDPLMNAYKDRNGNWFRSCSYLMFEHASPFLYMECWTTDKPPTGKYLGPLVSLPVDGPLFFASPQRHLRWDTRVRPFRLR